MLTTTVINRAAEIADALDESDKQLAPKESSHLNTLVALTIDSPVYESTPLLKSTLHDASKSSEDGYRHDQALAIFEDNIANRAAAIVDTAHTVVKPFISDVKKQLFKVLDSNKLSMVSDWKIEVYEEPSLLDNPTLDEVFEDIIATDNSLGNPEPFFLPLTGLANIFETEQLPIDLTHTDLKEDIMLIVDGSGGAEYLKSIYRRYFYDRVERNKGIHGNGTVRDRLTALFMGLWLLDNPLDDISVSLPVYNNRLSLLIKNIASGLKRYISGERQYSLTNKQLVLSLDKNNQRVIVNGPVYSEWLEAGGIPDVILGAAIEGIRTPFSIEQPRAESFAAKWKFHVSMRLRRANDLNVAMACKEAARVIETVIASYPDDHFFKTTEAKCDTKAVVKQNFGKLRSDLSNLSTLLLLVLEDCYFKGTSVINYIRRMEVEAEMAVKRTGAESETPEQIALLAQLELIIDCVYEQLILS